MNHRGHREKKEDKESKRGSVSAFLCALHFSALSAVQFFVGFGPKRKMSHQVTIASATTSATVLIWTFSLYSLFSSES